MKKLCTILTAVLVLGLAVSASATQFTNNLADRIADKNANMSGNVPNPPEILVGGETIGTAVAIGVPGASSGTTCDNVNDYDEACPYTGSTSGDEVYSISGVTGQVTIDLCNSGYDTKVYVYENAAGNLVACNDDACFDPAGNPYRSIVTCVNMTASSTYYVVVDGYFGDCGTYNISTSYSTGCPAACDPENCPPGSSLEGEPLCGTNYVDTFNGGCNSIPPVFSSIDCGETVCGGGGNYSYNGLSYRDTDWYQFCLPVACPVTATVCASFDVQLAGIAGDCSGFSITCGSVFGPPNSTVSCTWVGSAGCNNIIFVATSAFSGVPCGSPYQVSLDCDCVNATESKSWGGIKGLYR
jgi:hypothetical protein